MSNQSSCRKISVIIPTLNGAQWLDSLLTMLERQTLPPAELLIIDSGSSDSTLDIARGHSARIIEIDRDSFDHGGTRSMAAGMAGGDLLLFMTQDAVPSNTRAVEHLIQPLLADQKVAAAYGRQLPARDAGPFGAHLRAFNYPSTSEIHCWEDRHRLGFRTIFLSNSFAVYKHDVLAAHGYFPRRLLFGEDTLTAARLIKNGYCVAYVSDACVYHSHNYSLVEDMRRYFDIGVFHADQAETLMIYDKPGSTGKDFVVSELLSLLKGKKFYLLPESLARNIGKFIAYQLGKKHMLLPRGWARKISMNRSWWP